ncbi:CAP domain-containing protein [Frigidibacter sp. MR17.24]|uniref:CAP domain-containing protein n=1 Tax=Frigidibacter sp. MR17.24 TaxID=3127345 RepID=UPI003012D42E
MSNRLIPAALMTAALALAACGGTPAKLGADGKPLPRVYHIKAGQEGTIQYRFLDAVNALRAPRGAAPLALDAQLTAAAATHSRDMAVQNRSWHFGSDGSSPVQRVARTGYPGRTMGENISESYETELETLSAWMEDPNTARVVLDPAARNLGLSWYQEPNGKIWWTMVTGG